MRDTLHAEWLRATTTRGLAGLLAVTALVTGLGVFSTTSATTNAPWDLVTPMRDSVGWVLVAVNASFLALLAGARTFTDEYRHGTMTATLVADPRRIRSTTARLVAAVVSGAAVAVVSGSTVLVVRLVMAVSTGGAVALHGADAVALGGLVAALGAWAVLGAGLGALVRSPVVVGVGGLVWVLVVENLGAGLLGRSGAWLPGQVTQSLARTRDAVELLDPGAAAAVMVLHVTVASSVALLAVRRAELD